jgi:endoglucanase
VEFYVNPSNPAARQMREWEDDGRTVEASTISRIANHPIAEWLGNDDGVGSETKQLVDDASDAGKSALITVYYLPGRDCGQYSEGGAPDADAYRAWLKEISDGLKGHRATIILEPDAIAHTLDGCVKDKDEIEARYALLSAAITTLKSNPDVTVYLDAGNSSWIKDVDRMVTGLTKSGIAKADGFALNVSNFQTTDSTVTYGSKLSELLDGKHYVIDTSRNGNGPYKNTQDDETWCNPPGRKLGTPPTTDTNMPSVDAYLWIKQPGDSDGECREGAPAAGEWWPEYALQLAKA